RPYLDAQPLQRKGRRGIADMAERNMRLDREDVHGKRFIPQFFADARIRKTSWPGEPGHDADMNVGAVDRPTSSPSSCWPRRHRYLYKSWTGRCWPWPPRVRTD